MNAFRLRFCAILSFCFFSCFIPDKIRSGFLFVSAFCRTQPSRSFSVIAKEHLSYRKFTRPRNIYLYSYNDNGGGFSIGSDEDDELNDLWFSVDNDDIDEDDSLETQPPPQWIKAPPERMFQEIKKETVEKQSKQRMGRNYGAVPRPPEYWEFRIRLLRDYYEQHGHIDVPYLYVLPTAVEELVAAQNMTCEQVVSPTGRPPKQNKNQFRLGHVVFALRDMGQERVPAQLVKELNQMGMTWSPVGRGRQPAKFRQRLAMWNNSTRRDEEVDSWMWQQRYNYNRQETHSLPGPVTPERVEQLTEVGILPYKRPRTILRDYFDTAWQESLQSWKHESAQQSETMDVWVWEQLRMHHALVGGESAKGSVTDYLPKLLTAPRLQNLTECNFLQQATVALRGQNAISPEQDVLALNLDWDKVWSALTAFKKQHQHLRITPLLAFYDNMDLYSVSRRLMLEYKNIQRGSNVNVDVKQHLLLNNKRIQSLKDLGFFKDDKRRKKDGPLAAEYQWWEYYHELRRYRDRYGTVQASAKANPELNEWIKQQQEQFRKIMDSVNTSHDKKGPLSETHYVALVNLGMAFESPLLDTMPEQPPALFAAKSTRVGRPPALLALNPDVAATKNTSKNKLGEKHKAVVEESVWMTRYREMKLFMEKHGHCSIPSGGDGQLALWAFFQRVQYERLLSGRKSRSLTPKRIQLLKDIGFDFHQGDITTTSYHHEGQDEKEEWTFMVQELVRFKQENGHCFIPASLPSNPSLGQWVHTQRQLVRQQPKQKKLSNKQRKQLMEAGLDLEMGNIEYARRAFQTQWDARVAELKAFKAHHGHCRVEAFVHNHDNIGDWNKYKQLQKWVQDQRRFYKLWQENEIPSHVNGERIKELESLGFQWEE